MTVAVHIRRGDVTDADPDYFTSNEAILRAITEMKSILSSHQLNSEFASIRKVSTLPLLIFRGLTPSYFSMLMRFGRCKNWLRPTS